MDRALAVSCAAFAVIAMAPSIAAAQEPARVPVDLEFAQAESFLVDDTWVLDDGVGIEQQPWNTYDPAASYTPRGPLRFGVQLRVGALPGGAPPAPDGPLFDVSAFLDFRYSERLLLRSRIAIAISAQPYGEEYRPGGYVVSSSPLAFRLRVYPLSFDLDRYVAFRVAGEIGVQWMPQPGNDGGATGFFYGGTVELVGLLLDGQLELGVFGGMQGTGIAVLTRTGSYQATHVDGVVGATIGYLL